METVHEHLRIFVRRFGLLNASCCDSCCGEQVSLVQSQILVEVRKMGTPPIQQVADELGMDITTFSRQVKSLETKGLLNRRVAPEDRRVSLLGVSAEGCRVLEQIDRYMEARIDQIFTVMSPFERETVVRSLDLLNKAIAGAGSSCGSAEEKVACCK